MSDSRSFWHAYKALPWGMRYAKPYRKLGGISLALMTIGAGVSLLQPWPLAFLVDGVLDKKSRKPIPGFVTGIVGTNPIHLILFAVISGLVITLAIHGLAVATEYLNTKIHMRVVFDLRSHMFDHAQKLSTSFHDRQKSGNMVWYVNELADSLGRAIAAILPMAQALIILIGMFWISYRLDAMLSLLALGVVPFIYYAIGYYSKNVLPSVRQANQAEVGAFSVIHEAISMLRVVVAFGREPYEYKKYRTEGAAAVKLRVHVTFRQMLFSLAVQALIGVGTALVVGFGAYHVLEGRLSLGHLIVLLSYIAAIYGPLNQISGTLGALNNDFYHIQMCETFMKREPEVKEAKGAIKMSPARGDVSFEGVHFAYGGRRDTLMDIDIRVPAGQSVAIIGPTGAGKTTLVNLLIRYHDPQRGRILIDGLDIRDAQLASLRSQISMVLQEPLLFSGSVADNIRYGRLEASMRDIAEAARAANAHDFIMRLPQQYETPLGDKGAQLSGGERQRISIARAFLKSAPILILDEPTSSIDSKTEAVILDALSRLMEGRTTFLIAHRLSTIRNADQILVMNHGKIVEGGTSDELLRQGGLYCELYDAQLGKRPDSDSTLVQEDEADAAPLIADLAGRLSSEDPSVRAGGLEGLRGMDRRRLMSWARDAIHAGTIEEAYNGACVAQVCGFSDLAIELIERAAGAAGRDRDALVAAFRSFKFEPESVRRFLEALDPAVRAEADRLLSEFLGGAVEAPAAANGERGFVTVASLDGSSQKDRSA